MKWATGGFAGLPARPEPRFRWRGHWMPAGPLQAERQDAEASIDDRVRLMESATELGLRAETGHQDQLRTERWSASLTK